MTERCEKLYLLFVFAIWGLKNHVKFTMKTKNQHTTCVSNKFLPSHVFHLIWNSILFPLVCPGPRLHAVIHCLIYYWKNFNLFFVSFSERCHQISSTFFASDKASRMAEIGEKKSKQFILLSQAGKGERRMTLQCRKNRIQIIDSFYEGRDFIGNFSAEGSIKSENENFRQFSTKMPTPSISTFFLTIFFLIFTFLLKLVKSSIEAGYFIIVDQAKRSFHDNCWKLAKIVRKLQKNSNKFQKF